MLLTISGAPHAFRVEQSVQYGTVPGQPPWSERLYLDLLLPELRSDRVRPSVVMFHGGGWAEGDRACAMYPWLNPLLAAHGFVAASVTYRLSRSAPFPAQIHDAKASIRWLRANAAALGIDPDRIGAWGHSAGGHLAALLGTSAGVVDLEGPCGSSGYSSSVQCVVAHAPVTDFARFHPGDEDQPGSVPWLLFGGPPAEHADLVQLASPIAHVRSTPPPFLLVHGTEDETVPVEQTRILAGELRRRGGHVTVREIDGAYHNMTFDRDAQLSGEPWVELGYEALEFFSKHLGPVVTDSPGE